jgi:hypothetical protein
MWEKLEMKMLKWALLGSAAIAVAPAGAQADDLTALKAQLEALQARVTQLEAQPQASLPSGYSLMTFRSGGDTYSLAPMKTDQARSEGPGNGYTISVLPTADVTPAAEVTVSGEIRTYIRYHNVDSDEDGSDDRVDVIARARLVATGKADTAVGEVGGRIRVQEESGQRGSSDDSNSAVINQAYGWWKFSPNWQLIAGLWDSTAAVQAGVDWDFTSPVNTIWGDEGSTEQMRLVFNNGGPLTIALAVEDSEGSTYGGGADVGDIPAFAGYIAYDNNNLFLQVTGLWEKDDTKDGGDNNSDNFFIGAGARVGFGDHVTFTAGAGYSEGYQDAVYTTIGHDDQYWVASAGVIFKFGENSRIELGADYLDNDPDNGTELIDNSWSVIGGFYFEPVSQVTIGVNADYRERTFDGNNNDINDFNARFVTYLRF